MNKETLKTEKIDSSLLITFTRPDEMNTFSGKMMVEIMDTLDAVSYTHLRAHET